MEHSNPILMGNDSPQKFITVGEVMLRLTPPNYEKIRMASAFGVFYGMRREGFYSFRLGSSRIAFTE